jgi:hypothetical protein
LVINVLENLNSYTRPNLTNEQYILWFRCKTESTDVLLIIINIVIFIVIN